MELAAPYWLLLVVAPLAVATVLAWRRSALGLPPWRWWSSLTLRLLLLASLGLVMAGARAVLPRDDRAVVFAVDVSESIAPATRRRLLDWVRTAWEHRHPGDRGALVVFGRRARVELPLSETLPVAELPLEGLPRDRTALDRALQVAGGLLAGEDLADARVVLLSDGNGWPEPALREARALTASGVRVTTVEAPLSPSPGEVLIGDVEAPAVVASGEPFLLRVELISRSGGEAELHVVRDDGSFTSETVSLAPGINLKTVNLRLDDPGVHVYQLSLSAEGDANPANNVGGALVRVRGQPRVLLAQGDLVERGGARIPAKVVAEPLRATLERSGVDVTVVGTQGLPLGLDEMAGYDAIVLGSVGAEHWTDTQMDAIRRYVFDLGGGLIALGGEESFGLGGYYGTPVEEALPLSSDVREKKILPSLALVFCLDHSGSMLDTVGTLTKLDLAKEGAIRSVDLLQPFDRLGVIAFSDDPTWVVPMTEVLEPGPIVKRIRGIEIGGGTELGPALHEAHRVLSITQAQIRHVVLLTDGRTGEDALALSRVQGDLRRDRITLTTVGVGEEIDRELLTRLAESTGGRFLWARDPRTVPRLLTKEAVSASRALVVEREVRVRAVGSLESVYDWSQAPPLLGFVMTVAKPEAEVLLDSGPDDTAEDGPILARWRYGLGKATAFTSDASARWCGPWLEWPGFPRLFDEVVRWTIRDPEPPGVTTELQLDQGEGRVLVSVTTPEGNPVNGLQLHGRVAVPQGAPDVPRLVLLQSGPGHYEGGFETTRPGAYFVTVERELDEDDAQVAGTAAAVLAYPREYRDLTSNSQLLSDLAQITQGQHLTIDHPPEIVFAGERQVRLGYRSLEAFLLIAAAILLLLDVAARRLMIPESLLRLVATWRAARRGGSEGAGALLARMQAHKAASREAAQARRDSERNLIQRVSVKEASERVSVAPPPQTSAPKPESPTPPSKPKPAPSKPKPKPAPSRPKSKPRPTAEPGSAMSKLLEAKRKARGEGKSGE